MHSYKKIQDKKKFKKISWWKKRKKNSTIMSILEDDQVPSHTLLKLVYDGKFTKFFVRMV